ncbi:2153_t:CDS:2, partial [Dentiscutata erythropus]
MILQLRPSYQFFLILLGINLLCNDLGGYNSQGGVKAWNIFNPASANYDNENNFAPRPMDFNREDIPKNILIGSYIGEEYTFFKALSQQTVSNSNYLSRFETYMKAASEFKPDLFLCDHFLNEACYDAAWKLKKPSVGISSWLTPPTNVDEEMHANSSQIVTDDM